MSIARNLYTLSMLIRKLESIATLSDEERRAIQHLPVRTHNLDARQDIVRDGDQPTHCCLIVDGWTCRYKQLNGGRRQILSFHIPGDILDLQSLHIPTMDHSVTTLTRAVVGFIPHESLWELMARFPNIAAAFWRDMLIDAGISREWLISMGRRSALKHVAHLFCELYLKLQAVGLAINFQCKLPLIQTDLADALGLTPVHVNRVLREIRGRDLITLRSQMLVIKKWDELVRVSEFDPAYLQLARSAAGETVGNATLGLAL